MRWKFWDRKQKQQDQEQAARTRKHIEQQTRDNNQDQLDQIKLLLRMNRTERRRRGVRIPRAKLEAFRDFLEGAEAQ